MERKLIRVKKMIKGDLYRYEGGPENIQEVMEQWKKLQEKLRRKKE